MELEGGHQKAWLTRQSVLTEIESRHMGDTQLSALIEGSTQGGERGVRRWSEGGGRQAERSLPHQAEGLACQLETGKSGLAEYWLLVYLLVTCFFAGTRCLKRSNLMGEGFVLGGDLRGETFGIGRRAW